jgi:hypothetical protein
VPVHSISFCSHKRNHFYLIANVTMGQGRFGKTLNQSTIPYLPLHKERRSTRMGERSLMGYIRVGLHLFVIYIT